MEASWFDSPPVLIFIDTSVIINLGFDFDHSYFNTLKAAIDNGDFELIVTDILKGEFLKHCQEKIETEKKAFTEFNLLKNHLRTEFQDIKTKFEGVSAQVIWEIFVNKFRARNINADVDWRSVFENYFAERSPFTSGKKKNEFPDAFNLEMIKKLSPKKVAILSSDGDYQSIQQEFPNIIVYKNVADFTNRYISLREPEFTAKCKAALEKKKDRITEELIRGYSESSNFSVASAHGEIEDSYINELDIVKSDIVSFDKDQGFAIFKVWFGGYANLDVNWAVTVYDSEDKTDMILGWNSKSADVEVTIEATIKIMIDSEDAEYCDYEIQDVVVDSEELEVSNDLGSLDYGEGPPDDLEPPEDEES